MKLFLFLLGFQQGNPFFIKHCDPFYTPICEIIREDILPDSLVEDFRRAIILIDASGNAEAINAGDRAISLFLEEAEYCLYLNLKFGNERNNRSIEMLISELETLRKELNNPWKRSFPSKYRRRP